MLLRGQQEKKPRVNQKINTKKETVKKREIMTWKKKISYGDFKKFLKNKETLSIRKINLRPKREFSKFSLLFKKKKNYLESRSFCYTLHKQQD